MRNLFWKKILAAALCAALLCVCAGAAADDPESVSEGILPEIAETEMISSSGAGAWEGHLMILDDGWFRGDYYDEDFDQIETVTFTGRLTDPVQVSETVYRLTVTDVATEREPGTEDMDDDGIRIIYTDPIFPEGSTVLLTLYGTPEEEIPEVVRMLISGFYWEWDDYSQFITLTREDGWGFFTLLEEAEE